MLEKFVNLKLDTRKRIIYSVIAIMILVMALFCMLMFQFNFAKRPYVFANCTINAVGMIICFTLCVSNSGSKEIQATKKDALLFILSSLLYVEFFICGVEQLLDGYAQYNAIATFVLHTYFLSGGVYWITFWYYTDACLEQHRHQRVFKFIAEYSMAVYTLFGIGNIFYKYYSYIYQPSGALVYSLDGLYYGLMLWAIFGIALLMYVCINISKALLVRLILYLSLPICFVTVSVVLLALVNENSLDLVPVYNLIPLWIVFANVHTEQKNAYLEQQAENLDMKTKIMVSQIQPHFIYNTLATISSLARKEGAEETKGVVNTFANYLRVNLDSLTSDKLVSFEKELEHTKTYLAIERIRMGDDLKVEYDIAYTSFELPALTIQPLVENAVKYGLWPKEGGGTIWISTHKVGNVVIIEIKDDGVGFDKNHISADDRGHIGILNVRSRLEALGIGNLTIDSKPNAGCTSTIIIQLEGERK